MLSPNNSTATAVELSYLHQLDPALKREPPSTSLGWRLDPGAMVGNSKDETVENLKSVQMRTCGGNR